MSGSVHVRYARSWDYESVSDVCVCVCVCECLCMLGISLDAIQLTDSTE